MDKDVKISSSLFMLLSFIVISTIIIFIIFPWANSLWIYLFFLAIIAYPVYNDLDEAIFAKDYVKLRKKILFTKSLKIRYEDIEYVEFYKYYLGFHNDLKLFIVIKNHPNYEFEIGDTANKNTLEDLCKLLYGKVRIKSNYEVISQIIRKIKED